MTAYVSKFAEGIAAPLPKNSPSRTGKFGKNKTAVPTGLAQRAQQRLSEEWIIRLEY
jgi:ATP-dependent Clp protease ATP-binding subunit ClpA